MPTGYTPQSSIDRRKALMNQLRQTPMNDTGKKTDWGRGLAHMLRQYQAGQMGREQEAEISRNSEIEQSEMADLVSGILNPGASKAQDFGSMGVFQGGAPQPKADPSQSGGQGIDPYSSAVSGIGQDLGSRMSGGEAVDPAMLAGAQENAVSTPALGDRKYSSPMAQKLQMQQVIGNAGASRKQEQSDLNAERDQGYALDLQRAKDESALKRTEAGTRPSWTLEQVPVLAEDGTQRIEVMWANKSGETAPFNGPGSQPPQGGPPSNAGGNVPQALRSAAGGQPLPVNEVPTSEPVNSPTSKTDLPFKDMKEAQKAVDRKNSKSEVDGQLSTLLGNFMGLEEAGANVNYKKSPIDNIFEFTRANMQIFDKMTGTQVARFRSSIAQIKPALLNAVRQQSNMGAKGLDSDKELEFWLKILTDDSADIHTNVGAIYRLQSLLGSGTEVELPERYKKTLAGLQDEYNIEKSRNDKIIAERAAELGISSDELKAKLQERNMSLQTEKVAN